ncbi:hypothetical protein ACFO6V_14885 [Promicromonospora alba]|uniref:Uncharacterized protein n=1 Tax=Promicromonospora alba TaxID=1616110 RepID=A0ABV9HHY4_9MICO
MVWLPVPRPAGWLQPAVADAGAASSGRAEAGALSPPRTSRAAEAASRARQPRDGVGCRMVSLPSPGSPAALPRTESAGRSPTVRRIYR